MFPSISAAEDGFYKPPDRLRLPLIFYYAHTAGVYINKLMLAGLVEVSRNMTLFYRLSHDKQAIHRNKCTFTLRGIKGIVGLWYTVSYSELPHFKVTTMSLKHDIRLHAHPVGTKTQSDRIITCMYSTRNNATFDQKKENAGTCMLHQMQIQPQDSFGRFV